MRGDTEIIAELNRLLAGELTARDIYFVQARMCDDWGYTPLAERLAHEATDELAHAEALVDRILYLGGTPEIMARQAYQVGADVAEMLRVDLQIERDMSRRLNEVIAKCVAAGDNGTRQILDQMLWDTEQDHAVWLEAQLHVIGEIGLELYLAEQL